MPLKLAAVPVVEFSSTTSFTSDQVRHQLEKILSSPGFRRAGKLAAMLRFLVEETAAGRAGELKEYTIGVQVFGRRPDFNPQIDPIVRVQARNLRARLVEYYKDAGAATGLTIELAKGSYIPRLRAAGTASKPATPIAVLPFRNLSADPELEYFSDGLTEELIGSLSRLPALRVVARTSMFALKGERDIRIIADKLNVELLVEGSVRRGPERVRIQTEIVEARSGFVRWSDVFDVPLEDAVGIQERIAATIASALKLHGAPPPKPQPSRYGLQAYEHYLKARHQWQLRTRPGFERATQHFTEALTADPQFAPAYAGLADCYTLVATYGMLPGKEMLPKAKALAQRALELDPTSAQALTALGIIAATHDWDYALAEQYFKRAIELQPSYPDARQWYANFVLITLCRFEEAVEQLAQALKSDPLSVTIMGDLGSVLSLAGGHLEGLHHCEEAIARAPQFFRPYWQAGLIYERIGLYNEAVRSFERCRELCRGDVFESNAIGALGHTLAVARRPQEARMCLRQLELLSQGAIANPISFVLVYIGLGEFDAAVAWLNRAADAKIASVIWTDADSRSAPLRGDPRFHDLLSRLRLKRALHLVAS